MASRFSFSGGRLTNPWFRIGNIDAGSAGVMAFVAAVTMVVGAFVPSVLIAFALVPSFVSDGEVWRLATWPFAASVSFYAALDIVILWAVGNTVEAQIGRRSMTVMLGCLTVLPALLAVGLDTGLSGLGFIEFTVLLLFIADNPDRPFFFGIPIWILGVFFLVIRLLQMVQSRAIEQLAVFLFMLLLGALLGRAMGLLGNYQFIPKINLPGVVTGQRRVASRRNADAPTRNHRGRVVQGPWSSDAPTASSVDRAAEQAELDGLLDKISAGGIDSLSGKEKKRLNELSKRLR